MAVKDKHWALNIDVVGGCNLRCPSCPVGNSSTKTTPHGLMSPETLDLICEKARREFGRITVYLFNWAEPFLHPRLDELIRVVKRHHLPVEVSSNLNISRNLEKVLRAEPRLIRVSVSGFDQERYGETHKRGDIEKVKANMASLSEMRRTLKSRTRLSLFFHRYLGNHEDEGKMRDYAEGLGFEFSAAWAYLMPAEKYLALAQGGLGSNLLNEQDRAIISQFALDPLEAIEIAKKHKDKSCKLIEHSIAMNYRGDVLLCCATYDENSYSVGNFLDVTAEQLQKKRETHDYCSECTASGGHVYFNYDAPEFELAAVSRVQKSYPEVQTTFFIPPKETQVQRAARHIRNLIRPF